MPGIGRGSAADMVSPARILVTGADGFVGRHLQATLEHAFPRALLLVDPFDLRDATAVEAAVAAGRPDACIHLAAIATLAAARLDEARCWDVNLHGTLRLANAILRHVPACQMLFVSSADAYGGGTGAPINEQVPLAPRNLYAATKAAADLALGALAGEGLRIVRVRPFNHTGPGQSADLVIPAFARQIARIAARRQQPVLEVGQLETWRDFLDVRDVCTAYASCLRRSEALAPGEVLNIGSGKPRRIGDVLRELLNLAGIEAEVHTSAPRPRPEDVEHSCADVSRARALLDWAPALPWERTLADVLADWHARVAAGADA